MTPAQAKDIFLKRWAKHSIREKIKAIDPIIQDVVVVKVRGIESRETALLIVLVSFRNIPKSVTSKINAKQVKEWTGDKGSFILVTARTIEAAYQAVAMSCSGVYNIEYEEVA